MQESIYQVSKIIRRAGNVTRFHTHRMTHPDKVNIHSYNASVLAYHIAHEYNKTVFDDVDPFKCSFYMLMHDVAEHIVGDVPGHIKAMKTEVKDMFDELEENWHDQTLPPYFNFTEKGDLSLNETEKIICHFCDKFESLQTTFEELRFGNYSFKFIFQRMTAKFPDMINKYNEENKFIVSILWKVYSEFMDDCRKKGIDKLVGED